MTERCKSSMEGKDIIERVKQNISAEMEEFGRQFESVLHTRLPLADSVIRYFLSRSGKQLRPIVTILAAKLIGQVNSSTIYGAVSLELLHNATLMHDDVIDQSDQRRGVDTINKIWDNRVAVLMGDFFLSKCLYCSHATGSLAISRILADMVTELVEGELEQISNIRSRMLSEASYFSVIKGKTASLFSACMKVGALSVGANEDQMARIAHIGELMGLLFQIRDDIFDYYPATSEVGKPTGHDILEGKITLPLLYALQHGPSEEVERMRAIIDQNEALSSIQIGQLVEFAKSVGGIDYAYAKMKQLAFEAKKELAFFPDSASRESLSAIIDYFIVRKY